MRTCTKCNTSKRENHFYKRKDDLSYMCKDCYSIWRKDDYKKYSAKYKKQREQRRGSVKFRFQQLKSNCKKRSLSLDLTIEQYELLIQAPCFYCENKLCIKVQHGVGLDRLDSGLGYSIDNCVSCCAFCNTIKNDLLTPGEMKRVAQLLILERQGRAPVNIHMDRVDIVI